MSPEQFSQFARPFPDALCLITSTGKILAVNEIAARFLEKEQGSLINHSLYDLATDDPEKIHNNLRNWARSGQMVPGSLSLNIGGSIAKCNCNGSLMQPKTDQTPAQVLLRFEHRERFSKSFSALNKKIEQLQKEIIERRHAEQELAKRKAEFEAMFISIPDAAVFVDPQRRIIMCNPATRVLFGYEYSEMIGRTTEMFYVDSNDFKDQGKRRYSVDPDVKDNSAYEVQYRRKNGSVFWGETLGTRVEDKDGNVIGFIGLVRDVTERKNTEEELYRYREHLEQSVKERTIALENSYQELESYSYSIAHDLRSPLRSIMGFSQILLDETREKLDQADLDYLHRIIHSSSHMAELIDDILELSRVSRTDMEVEEINLSELSSDICNSLSVANPERKIEWKIQPGMKLRADHHLLYLVMSNLVGNAFKFTHKEAEAVVEIGSTEKKGETVFFVRDNGVGFDMKYSKKLFGLFQRLHHPDDYEGTGVGLATVERIIKRHGGWIQLEGEPGKGAVARFCIHDKNSSKIDKVDQNNNSVSEISQKRTA